LLNQVKLEKNKAYRVGVYDKKTKKWQAKETKF
jgi:hypothetical protein